MLDASVALKWFLKESGSSHAREYLARFRAGDDDLIAPDLLVSEVGNGLRSASLSKRLQVEFAAEASADFLAINLTFVPVSSIGAKAMEIALKHRTTFYDAAYVALASKSEYRCSQLMGRCRGHSQGWWSFSFSGVTMRT